MLTYAVAFVLAAVVAAVLTPLVVRLAHKIDAVDLPGEARKIHTRAIPRIGGLAVFVAFFVPILGLAIYTNRISGLIYADSRLVTALIVGSVVIVLLGVYDDIRGADAKLKLVVQTAAAVTMWMMGFRIELLGNPFGETVQLGMAASLSLTTLWFVGVINALNLIDGLDGLATGTAMFAALVLFGVSFVDHAVLLCLFTATLVGSLLGFLFFNFNPAKIFLGDSGSMFLGFILAALSVWTQRKGATAAALLIPVLALGLPLLDTTLSVVRRISRRRSPFQADREHLHHRLLALGLTHRNAVYTLYTLSAVFALGALALLDNDTTHRSIALATVGIIVFIIVRKAGVFSEPAANQPTESRVDELRVHVRQAARNIREARDRDQVWALLLEIAPRLFADELRLAWYASDRDEHVQEEVVAHWKPEDAADYTKNPAQPVTWKLDGSLSPYDKARRLPLSDQSEQYGDLRVLLKRSPISVQSQENLELSLELLREALIDFCVAKQARDEALYKHPQVVRIESSSSNRTAEGISA